MRPRRLRWTDILGVFGLVVLVAWTPMYLADGHAAGVVSDEVVLPPPREGMRLETVVVLEFANGTRYEIGPWVDVAYDRDPRDSERWVASVSRHPADVVVGPFRFEQQAGVERHVYAEGRSAGGSSEGDRWAGALVHANDSRVAVHASTATVGRDHELVSARFDTLTVARDVAEATVQVLTRVPNLDPGDGKAQRAASSVSGRVVRFDDQVLYAANGGDLRRVGAELGGLFGSQAKGGVLCDLPFRAPWTTMHAKDSIVWEGPGLDGGCMQYQWDWYSPKWPAPVGFHREVLDEAGDLVYQLDVVPKRIVPGDETRPLERAPEERWPRAIAPETTVPVAESLGGHTRWAGIWTTPEILEALQNEVPPEATRIQDVVGLAGIAWIDREPLSSRFAARAGCTWEPDRPVLFWADFILDDGSLLKVAFDSGHQPSGVGEVRWRSVAHPSGQGRSVGNVTEWWSGVTALQQGAAERIAAAGGDAPAVPWLGAFGRSVGLPAHGLDWDAEDACLDLDVGSLAVLLPPTRPPSLSLLTGAAREDGGEVLVVARRIPGPAAGIFLESVAVPAPEARSASPLTGPFAAASGLEAAKVRAAGELEVVEMVAGTFGVLGASAVGVALLARFASAMRAGGWLSAAALVVRRGRDGPSRRSEIAAFVTDHPGVTLSELVSGLGLGWGMALHHLEALRKAGRVARITDGTRVHLFPVEGQAAPRSESERWRQIVTRRSRYADVWNALLARPGGTATELSKEVGRHRTSVSRTLGRLRDVGLVEAERHGRKVRFRIADDLPATHRAGPYPVDGPLESSV